MIRRTAWLWIGLALAAAALPQLGSDYLIGLGITLLMWIALAESWIVLSGMTGYVSFGHAVFYGLGAYVMVVCWNDLPGWAGFLAAGLAAGLFALAIGYPVLRVRGPYFVILTYGLAELVKFLVINTEAALGKFGRLVFGAPPLATLYYLMLGLAAIREDETAAENAGVPVARLKLIAFALSAAIPGMVGAVMALRSSYFEPLQAFSPTVSFNIVAMAVIGGGDDAPGPILGALFLVLLSELLWAHLPEVYMIILGLLVIGFVLFAPEGLHGRLQRLRRP
ncbi:MAG: branched-chain amino acid ABC transporter permease [Rhodospirillales bacterium]|nr:branched-chain amino acid ABC transporter permease [Rhodospirillales bacterium]